MSRWLIVGGAVLQALGFIIVALEARVIARARREDRRRGQKVEVGQAVDLSETPEVLEARVDRLERLMQEAFEYASEQAGKVDRRLVREVGNLRGLLNALTAGRPWLPIGLFLAGLASMTGGSYIAAY